MHCGTLKPHRIVMPAKAGIQNMNADLLKRRTFPTSSALVTFRGSERSNWISADVRMTQG